MKIKNVNLSGVVINETELKTSLYVKEISNQAMFDQVIAQNAGERQGTHSTLTKAEVRGGGKKPVPQKKTGNARQGSIRNPHYVGGGIVFGPKPVRNYKVRTNAKVAKLALKSALSLKMNEQNFYLFENDLSKVSTKAASEFLSKMNFNNQKVLFVLDQENVNNDLVFKSFANIEKVLVKSFNQVSTKDVLYANVVLIQQKALEALEKCN